LTQFLQHVPTFPFLNIPQAVAAAYLIAKSIKLFYDGYDYQGIPVLVGPDKNPEAHWPEHGSIEKHKYKHSHVGAIIYS